MNRLAELNNEADKLRRRIQQLRSIVDGQIRVERSYSRKNDNAARIVRAEREQHERDLRKHQTRLYEVDAEAAQIRNARRAVGTMDSEQDGETWQ
jgi:hypothetical protein